MLVIISLLLCISGIASVTISDEPRCVFTAVVFRHGDRTPIYTFPKDEYSESDWSNGFGQLTSTGIKQLNSLGTFIRKNYALNINKENYLRKEVYVRSSDADRTIMSAQSLLKTLFPGQPIPIHTVNNDYLLVRKSHCPRYDALFDVVYRSPQANRLRTEYKRWIDFTRIHTGLPKVDIRDAVKVYGTLAVENIYSRLPRWALERAYLTSMKELKYKYWGLRFHSDEMKRLKVGPLLSDISKHMVMVMEGKPTVKLMLYSAHDYSLIGLLSALQALHFHSMPNYGAAIFFELMKTKQQRYFVKVSYLNGSVADRTAVLKPIDISLPRCHYFCPANTFLEYVQPLVPTDIVQECSRK